MYIIAGLGNPSREYEKTRHNAGFDAVDILADKLGVRIEERKHRALCAKGIIGGERVLLMKPQTFMNLSGESIRDAADFYKVDPEHIIIMYDDISLEVGQLRIRTKGSAGGHNGIKSIIAHLGTQEFPRVKIGVGAKPDRMDLADYVLSRFSQTDRAVMEDAFQEAANAAQMMIQEGADAAMNRYNGGRKQCRTL
ncbi:MAG TPA: aminoacyl-tRNA hydrolase [Candidatus Caccovicinus merdipullorum]|uniref:Peptidyl-tRNA hydrolase n=1 Tax=Candidatus Caccovicinus merdipullorum TaxID=2840724 RepID=A0A9D1KHE5_9FIRM|nr:aminoacyl-tRNA hydrolase [Candidatus Caccovicinus merdipullorum]